MHPLHHPNGNNPGLTCQEERKSSPVEGESMFIKKMPEKHIETFQNKQAIPHVKPNAGYSHSRFLRIGARNTYLQAKHENHL